MDHFTLRSGVIHAEDVPLAAIAEAVGPPVYVYSRATLARHARVFRDALSILPRVHIAYAIKANPNLAVLRVMAQEGYGADVVWAEKWTGRWRRASLLRALYSRALARMRAKWFGRWRPGLASSTSNPRRKGLSWLGWLQRED